MSGSAQSVWQPESFKFRLSAGSEWTEVQVDGGGFLSAAVKFAQPHLKDVGDKVRVQYSKYGQNPVEEVVVEKRLTEPRIEYSVRTVTDG